MRHSASIQDVCTHFGISRTTFQRWSAVFDPTDLRSLESKPKTPKHKRHSQIPAHVVERIRAYREHSPLMSKKAIAQQMADDGIQISPSSVGRVIQRHHLYFADTPSHRLKRLYVHPEQEWYGPKEHPALEVLRQEVCGLISTVLQKKNIGHSGGISGLTVVFLATAIAACFSLGTQAVMAATTAPLNHVYNGRLLDSSGNSVTSEVTIRFSYWTTADFKDSELTSTGSINTATGTYVGWYEEQTITPSSNGLFSVELGSGTALPTLESLPVSTLTSLYLQVEVKLSGAADSTYDLLDSNTSNTEIDRTQIFSVPFARNADLLDQHDTGTASGSIPVLSTSGSLVLGSGAALQFGENLTKQMMYDTDTSRFTFNADVFIDGTLTISGSTIGSGTGAGTLRWTGSAFEGYDGTNWKNMSDGGGGFVGTTPSSFSGAFISGSTAGYEAANALCAAAFTGSYMCTIDDIMRTIRVDVTSMSGAVNGWVSEGAPGYTADANDCKGWTSSGTSILGSWWKYSTDAGVTITNGGGQGLLTNCAVEQPISCCR